MLFRTMTTTIIDSLTAKNTTIEAKGAMFAHKLAHILAGSEVLIIGMRCVLVGLESYYRTER
jgi:hypothetical protein